MEERNTVHISSTTAFYYGFQFSGAFSKKCTIQLESIFNQLVEEYAACFCPDLICFSNSVVHFL